MTITRNGIKYDLTNTELRLASMAYDRYCFEQDIKSKKSEIGIYMNHDEIATAVETAERYLSKNDSYFDAYWDCIENAIRDTVNHNS